MSWNRDGAARVGQLPRRLFGTLDMKRKTQTASTWDDSQGDRRNFPTISARIPHEAHSSRDASSEVCVNQRVYMP